MSQFDNPTALTVGATGKLCGLNYRVIGRVVLGTNVDGETWYWNEYNLLDDSGQNATLVFEETENGPEWKLFVRFEPLTPMTAAEAARKKVGDTVALNDKPVPITFVGRSRVYHIEGQAPEGVEIGDIANYFNADTGFEMQVASWTGDEIEFYRGIDVSVDDVAVGFRLPVEKLTGGGLVAAVEEPESDSRSIAKFVPLVIIAAVALLAVVSFNASQKQRWPAPPRKPPTPPDRLTGAAVVPIHGRLASVKSHTVVEMARVGSRYDCHEYRLRDADGESWLLVNGLAGSPAEWHLLRPASPAVALTPTGAAALRVGQTLTLDDTLFTVWDLFQARVAGAETMFGLLARAGSRWVMIRWTSENIECYLGQPVPERELLAETK